MPEVTSAAVVVKPLLDPDNSYIRLVSLHPYTDRLAASRRKAARSLTLLLLAADYLSGLEAGAKHASPGRAVGCFRRLLHSPSTSACKRSRNSKVSTECLLELCTLPVDNCLRA